MNWKMKYGKERGIVLSTLIIIIFAIVAVIAIVGAVIIATSNNKGSSKNNMSNNYSVENIESNKTNMIQEENANNNEETNNEDTGYIGKYVAYIPESGSYRAEEKYTGAYSSRDFTTQDVGWRIWDINDKTLTLISDDVVSGEKMLYLKGNAGYNNAVKILNDLCEKCYSNSTLEAKARSFNIDDIEATIDSSSQWQPTDYRPYHYSSDDISEIIPYSTNRKYGENKKYPYIWQLEENSNIDGKIGQGLKRSQQETYYSGDNYKVQTANSYIEPMQTAWMLDIGKATFKNANYPNLILKTADSSERLSEYWLASRCCTINSTEIAMFSTFYVDDYYGVSSKSLMYSNGDESIGYIYEMGIRPIVEIDLTKVNIDTITTEGNSKDTAYALEVKEK